jgi:hypothetical protein
MYASITQKKNYDECRTVIYICQLGDLNIVNFTVSEGGPNDPE